MECCLQLSEGCLRYRSMGNMVALRLECPLKKDALYRAFVEGETGSLDLGAMMPQGRCLVIERRFSLDYLQSQGVFPPKNAGMVKSHSFGKTALPSPWREGNEELLAPVFEKFPSLTREKKLVYRKQEEGYLVGMAYDGKRAFPLVELFCLGDIRILGGETYVVYAFDEKGRVKL